MVIGLGLFLRTLHLDSTLDAGFCHCANAVRHQQTTTSPKIACLIKLGGYPWIAHVDRLPSPPLRYGFRSERRLGFTHIGSGPTSEKRVLRRRPTEIGRRALPSG